MKKSVLTLTLIALFNLVGCASPAVVKTTKPGDTSLSCEELKKEYAEAEQFKADADKEKKVTGGNVARAIFFWPALFGTFSNANDAIKAADERMAKLSTLMDAKSCGTAS